MGLTESTGMMDLTFIVFLEHVKTHFEFCLFFTLISNSLKKKKKNSLEGQFTYYQTNGPILNVQCDEFRKTHMLVIPAAQLAPPSAG